VRKGSPAEKAKIQPTTKTAEGIEPGDEIKSLELRGQDADGKPVLLKLVSGPAEGADVRQIDPVRLPDDVARFGQRTVAAPPRQVKLTVLRKVKHTPSDVVVDLEWDDAWTHLREPATPAPMAAAALSPLGIAYRVMTVVDAVTPDSPAAAAGVQPNDIIRKVTLTLKTPTKLDANKTERYTIDLDKKDDRWLYAFAQLQLGGSAAEIDLDVLRGSQAIPLKLTTTDDQDWPMIDRGFIFDDETRLQRAESFTEALALGWRKTWRTVGTIYDNLLAMIYGRISFKALAGPISIARVSYFFAGKDAYQFIVFLAMINVNLAVVNFLPIPVLDGGHMVFLIYEAIRGKPASERIRVAAMFVGLGLILLLMVSVIILDLMRLFYP
jgi:regulator of sigma E protease